MRELFLQQKLFSIGEKFSVKDIDDQEVYWIEGSFMKVPKTFSIMDVRRNEVAQITKKVISFLPTFYVDVVGQDPITIKKDFTFFKAKYSIEAKGIEVQGSWWDMNFEVLKEGEVVGSVQKKWMTFADHYVLTSYNTEIEPLLVSLVVAIDYVKASQGGAPGGAFD